MVILLTLVHILVCVFLVIVVLLQSGKAADLAGAFGGMGSQTAFGPRGSATLLSKATTLAAALFMITSLTLAVMASRSTAGPGGSVLDTHKPAQTAPAPTQTAPLPKSGTGNTVTIPLTPQGTPAPQGAPAQPAPAKPAPAQPAK
ncbi:MAG TPA: preprotein translocase subunit SecG [Bryobacteraceae bacterium]|nr:preprotein translocase subunit SecG [Bryobacteraceae bacterium]